MKKTPHFDVHIDRLAIPTIPPGGERRLRDAIQQELTRLLAQKTSRMRGEPASPAHSRLQPLHKKSAALEIAEKIHRGLERS
jgi:hypothetical protein